MASSRPLSRDDHLVGTLKRPPPLRTADRHHRPTGNRDAVLLGTTGFCGDSVYDIAGKFLGEIAELVVDIHSGRIAFALMTAGAFLGMGRKLFPIPWNAVTVDREYQRCVISIGLERVIDAPSVDGDFMARMADPGWATEVHTYFGCRPYWE